MFEKSIHVICIEQKLRQMYNVLFLVYYSLVLITFLSQKALVLIFKTQITFVYSTLVHTKCYLVPKKRFLTIGLKISDI